MEPSAIDVDPAAVGKGVLAFVMIDANAWMGDSPTREALREIPEIQEAHIVAGSASVLVKARAATTEQLQDVLRRLYRIAGVTNTEAIVVLDTFFERTVAV